MAKNHISGPAGMTYTHTDYVRDMIVLIIILAAITIGAIVSMEIND